MSSLLTVMALAVPAMAGFGGGAIVSVDHAPDEFVAGEIHEVMYTILWMGETPVADSSTLEFRNGSAAGLTFQATSTGTPGQYIAEVKLPEPGSWSWVAQHSRGWSSLGEVEVEPVSLANVLNNDVAALVLAVAATAGLARFLSRAKVELGPGVFQNSAQVRTEGA